MKFITISVLIIFSIFSIFSCWFPLFAQGKEFPKLTLGVIPLKATGVQEYEALSISNRLHSKLVDTKQFRVVEIEKINNVLSEIGFQQYGFCTDEECAARVGNMLGAQWMVTGSFGRIGQTYTIDVRMIDVESRHVFLTASRDYRGPIDGMLNYIEYIANELASKTAHRLKYGSLEIFSHPSGVFVYIDGELKGKTPYELKEISIGDHFIELKKENYLRWEKNIVIESLKLNKLNAELKKIYALSVKSFPKYSKIYINGKYVANTPWAAKLPEGSYKLVIKKSNYLSESKLINLSNDEEIFFNLKNIRVLESITKSREVELEDKKIEKKSGSKKWIWGLGVAVLIGGGVAAIIILNNGNEDSSSDVIGTPPDPPK